MSLSWCQISPIHVCHPVSGILFLMFSTLICLVFQMVFPFRFPQQNLCIFHFPIHPSNPSYLIVCLDPQIIFNEE
jgi:hypothetical protein